MSARVNPYAGFADDVDSLAGLPEVPERVLASARAIFTLYAGCCQPELAVDDAWPSVEWPVPSWRVDSCADLSGLAADQYTGGGQ